MIVLNKNLPATNPATALATLHTVSTLEPRVGDLDPFVFDRLSLRVG